ncbi:MAG TPA: hypothetical protein VJL81_03315 [Solirubrobacterales bacterium]|nr:hypothetical protein [Solirubrobacterales bacterium]
MAKFEIEIPDDLLVLLDNVSRDAGENREEFLSRVAEEGLITAGDALTKKFLERLGPPRPMGGDSAQIIREMRDQRVPPFHPKDQDHE